MAVPRAELEQLRIKYVEMLSMRVTHAAGGETPGAARLRMASLASRFPGALREIDELPLDEIRARIAQLNDAIAGARGLEPWMEAMALFHALTRGALEAKRWLRGRKRADADVERSFAAHIAAHPRGEDARRWAGALDALASPPGGRVTGLVYARIAAAIGTTADEARRLVFGEGRRSRSKGRPP